MSRRWHPYFLFVVIVFVGVSVAHGQAAAEYGAMTAKMGATTAAAAKVPLPNLTIPGGSAPARKASPAPAPAASAPTRLPTADEAATANRLGLQRRAGPEGAEISFRSVPEHAQIFIDTQFVGTAPMILKLAPGHHRVYVTAPDMLASDQQIEVTPKQIREIVLSLNPRAPKKVELH
jgi:hypothetical protein